jgi:hypothetical protein
MTGNMDEVLRKAFHLARLRLRFIFVDLLWKAIWLALTLVALFVVASWFGYELRSIGWVDTGNRVVNGALAVAVLRQYWAAHRIAVFGAVGAALFFSLVIWFVLEAAFRSRIVSGRFDTFFLSNVLRCLVITAVGLALAIICFGRYAVTPVLEWHQLWPDTRGGVLIALVTVGALAFLLTIIDTLIRSDAIELLGTDLIRVTGLVGILVLTETMISGSCVVMVGVGILNIAGWRAALAMLGAAAVAMIFMSVLHSYLLLVRFSAVDIMRHNVVEV